MYTVLTQAPAAADWAGTLTTLHTCQQPRAQPGRCKTAPPEPVPRTGLLPPPSRGASPGPIAHLAAGPRLLQGRGSHVGFSSAGSHIAPSYHNIAPACHQTEVEIIFSAYSRSRRGAGHQTAPTHTRHHSLHSGSSIARYPAWAPALHNT